MKEAIILPEFNTEAFRQQHAADLQQLETERLAFYLPYKTLANRLVGGFWAVSGFTALLFAVAGTGIWIQFIVLVLPTYLAIWLILKFALVRPLELRAKKHYQERVLQFLAQNVAGLHHEAVPTPRPALAESGLFAHLSADLLPGAYLDDRLSTTIEGWQVSICETRIHSTQKNRPVVFNGFWVEISCPEIPGELGLIPAFGENELGNFFQQASTATDVHPLSSGVFTTLLRIPNTQQFVNETYRIFADQPETAARILQPPLERLSQAIQKRLGIPRWRFTPGKIYLSIQVEGHIHVVLNNPQGTYFTIPVDGVNAIFGRSVQEEKRLEELAYDLLLRVGILRDVVGSLRENFLA